MSIFRLRLSSTHIVILSFVGVILAGTLLLKMPFSHYGELTWTDALFTATSATCVTGLIVKDTGKDFTLIGQIIIMVMIQVGGVGLMTLSSAFLLILGRRITRQQWTIIREMFDVNGQIKLRTLILGVLAVTLIFESIGTTILYFWWRAGNSIHFANDPVSPLFFNALFHAVSAFCNAGFSLFSRNLEPFVGDPITCLVIASLFIIGGLGYFVIVELAWKIWNERQHWRRLPAVISLHTRLVLRVTVLLIVVGTALILLFEIKNPAFSGMNIKERILSAFFQAVTPRTAGFNTVPIDRLTTPSLLLIMVLMFIGASPGSTGGGIKTTTLSILFGSARAEIYGEDDVLLFHRKIPRETVRRAIALGFISVGVVGTGALLLLFFEVGFIPFKDIGNLYLKILFETISAFGTVGLSTGLTSTLSDASKLLLCLIMLFGRVGPLTIAYTIAIRKKTSSAIELPEEPVMIG